MNETPTPNPTPIVVVPTVGRVMWYRPSRHDIDAGMVWYPPSAPGEPHQPMRAMVDYVWSDRCINATVTDHAGRAWTRPSCRVRQEGDPVPMIGDSDDTEGHVEWMPYQTAQARKA